jgi:predicted DsbA family dithiol-disulfide isomerase
MENQDMKAEKEVIHEAVVESVEVPGDMPAEEMKTTISSKKTQNLLSAVILLAGLFVGSLFVDVAQLVKGSGFSEGIVKKVNVLEAGGKTWVAYSDPIVRVNVITDTTCEKCAPDQVLVWLRRVMPTLVAQQIDYNTEEGKSIMEQSGAFSLPAFIFSGDVTKTDMFGQAEKLFTKQDDTHYVLSTDQLGIPAGKFLALPEIKEGDIQTGSKDAKVKVVEYSDFQCPYCRLFHPAISQMLKDYKDQVLFSYKQFPLDFHPQANNAALASECANEQGKFIVYADNLFAKQDEWSKTEGVQKFKDYATRFGMKNAQFNACLDSKKYQDKINADTEEGKKFGVTGTPGTFVNDQFIGGAVSIDALKKIIDAELAK